MDRRKLFTGLLIALVAGISWLLSQQEQGVKPPEAPDFAGHVPDYYLDNFTMTTMDLEGKPAKALTAERMLHYPDNDTTELTYPYIVIYDGERPPWEVRSETGQLSGDGKTLLLQGVVTIDRAESLDTRPMHIVTRDMTVKPDENYAETSQHVTIHSRNDHQESDGMQAWLDKPIRLKFFPNVRGRYELN